MADTKTEAKTKAPAYTVAPGCAVSEGKTVLTEGQAFNGSQADAEALVKKGVLVKK